MAISGIYEIRNNVNNRLYIGSCVNFAKRKSKHLKQLEKGTHPNNHLQNAYSLYGRANFSFNVLEICEPHELIVLEQKHIDLYKSDELYNIRLIAKSNFGLKASEKTKKKMSDSAKIRGFTEEHKANISKSKKGWAPMKGKKFTKEHINKIKQKTCKSVFCIETKQEFASVSEAAAFCRVSVSAITQSLKKKTRVNRLYTFQYEAL